MINVIENKKQKQNKTAIRGTNIQKRKLSKTSGIEEIRVCCSGPLTLATFRFWTCAQGKEKRRLQVCG